MDLEYLIKNYASIILSAYIKSIKINALDIEIIDKNDEIIHYTKEKFEEMLGEFNNKGGV